MILNNIEIQDLQSRHSSQDKHIFLYIVVEGMIPVIYPDYSKKT